MAKYRIRRRGPLPFKYVFLLSISFFIFLTSISLLIINKNIEPHLMKVAESKTKQFAAKAINKSISKNIAENLDINQLIIMHTSGGEISYSFNPKEYNRVIVESTSRVQKYLDDIESGRIDASGNDHLKYSNGIIYRIPLGVATKNLLFATAGPEMPVRFEMLGNVTSDLETKVTETGINNTFLEVYVKIKVRMNVIIPLLQKETMVIKKVKVGDLFLQGKVPQYYNGNGNGNPPISIPGD